MNARCAPGGSIRVEVTDRFDQVAGPAVERSVTRSRATAWRTRSPGNATPTIPTGRDQGMYWRKLRFHLHDAELFSFRFKDLAGDSAQFKTEKEW